MRITTELHTSAQQQDLRVCVAISDGLEYRTPDPSALVLFVDRHLTHQRLVMRSMCNNYIMNDPYNYSNA